MSGIADEEDERTDEMKCKKRGENERGIYSYHGCPSLNTTAHPGRPFPSSARGTLERTTRVGDTAAQAWRCGLGASRCIDGMNE